LLLTHELNTLISAHTSKCSYNTTRTNKQAKISEADLLANEVAVLRGEVVDLVTPHPIPCRRLKCRSRRRCLRLRRVLLSLDHKEVSSTGSTGSKQQAGTYLCQGCLQISFAHRRKASGHRMRTLPATRSILRARKPTFAGRAHRTRVASTLGGHSSSS
jgi:hypothetical protein